MNGNNESDGSERLRMSTAEMMVGTINAERSAAATVAESEHKVIGYVGRILPAHSETFVVREINALRRRGLAVKTYSIHRPGRSGLHPEMEELAEEVEVLKRPALALFWLAHLLLIVFHPARYFGGLWRYVLAAGEPLRVRLRALNYFVVAPYFALLLRRDRVEHLHAHFANAPASVAMIAAALAGIRFSFTAHAYDIFVDGQLMRQKLREAEFVAAISRFNVDYISRRYRLADSAPMEVVHCGVDPEDFKPKHGPSDETATIVAVGRLDGKKGFDSLIRACARLKAAGRQTRCYIIGQGEESERLQRLVGELELGDTVTLTGKLLQPQVREYYRRAGVFVMPSRESGGNLDGIPVVLMEAMAMGIPVVSTRVSGIPELVEHGRTGLLVEQNDAAALAGAIEKILGNPATARRLGRAGREKVAGEFNVHRSAEQMHLLFKGSRGPRAAASKTTFQPRSGRSSLPDAEDLKFN